jgi:hypothetical protein
MAAEFLRLPAKCQRVVLFGVPFGEIAPIVRCSASARRQLASRARRRVKGGDPAPDTDLNRQREVVDAFLAAAREGDFAALLAVLDPEIAAAERFLTYLPIEIVFEDAGGTNPETTRRSSR